MPTEEQRKRLLGLVAKAELSYEIAMRAARSSGQAAPVRHKCFISYHGADIDQVSDFVEAFNDVFIPRVLGVSDNDQFKDPVNSEDDEYIKAQIGSRYLSDSTVTILFVGSCTWSRRFVDWELSSSLRDGSVNKRNGLLGITPPDHSENKLPQRFADNWAKDASKYARYHFYPRDAETLRGWIEDAFQARTSRSSLVENGAPLKRTDSACS